MAGVEGGRVGGSDRSREVTECRRCIPEPIETISREKKSATDFGPGRPTLAYPLTFTLRLAETVAWVHCPSMANNQARAPTPDSVRRLRALTVARPAAAAPLVLCPGAARLRRPRPNPPGHGPRFGPRLWSLPFRLRARARCVATWLVALSWPAPGSTHAPPTHRGCCDSCAHTCALASTAAPPGTLTHSHTPC